MELPVDDVVPSDEVLTDAGRGRASAAEADRGRAELRTREDPVQAELDASKEKAIAAREDSTKQSDMIRDIVKQAVAGAMAEAKGSKPAGKKIKYQYDDQGLIAGAETTE